MRNILHLCLSLKVFQDQSCTFMQRKKSILIFSILIFLYILYRTVLLEGSVCRSLFADALLNCNVPSAIRTNSSQLVPTSQALEECELGELVYGNYCVFSPYLKESTNASATLSTQGTVEFLHHVVVLCRRWSGPISVAVYSPPEDHIDARRLVNTLRECDFCIRHWVSWHFFYFKRQSPPDDIGAADSLDCASISSEQRPKKRRSQGIYPINAGRNIARSRAVTHFVFPIDIELYPSSGILPKFERMLRTVDISEGLHVWVIPVFEVYAKFKAPTTKQELRTMYMKKQAISFHRYRCDICHRIPNLTQWLEHGDSLKSEVNETLEALKIWATVKRNKKYRLQVWEPFFIGTKEDPDFDVRLSWEGKQNKMQVAFEMCLMDYSFHIVENAFLVHSPGINVFNSSKEKLRQKYTAENNKLITVIRRNLVKKYGQNKNC